MSDWIPTSERLPDKGECLIVFIDAWGNKIINISYHFRDDYFIVGFHNNRVSNVTHWMPLPEPPN